MANGASARNILVAEDYGLKVRRHMAQAAVIGGWQVAVMFAKRDFAIVAQQAITGNTGVVVAAIRSQLQETQGAVAIVAFSAGDHVLVGFANGRHAIMTGSAYPKNFLVVHERRRGETQDGGMAGLAHITGGDMVRWLAGDVRKTIVVTISASG